MKNISTILSIIALALIGVLFYFQFAKGGQQKTAAVKNDNNDAASKFSVAYFDIDSLQEHYEYFKDVSGDMKKKESAMNAELNDLTNKYQRTVRKWQERGNNITQAEMETAQREVGLQQQQIQQRKGELEQEMQKLQVDRMSELRKQVEEFLKDYNKDKKYAYILSYEPGFIIYYKDSAYNITGDLITGLNAQYKDKKK
ncbi:MULTISPECIES: OmpH family outer membrane protein [Niastella]|uniref:OmpH family outer membrane protein n=1 Tax=Niastella soli TaxID=2821487 RepID=A0ABS3YZG5_9BACT|nr:OmpH family outer membrane protein [Niastella soli]MBO9203316.1 OmpH family outer membrane protein [Niastella soli]